MTALTPSPPDRGGHDNMSGNPAQFTQSEWYQARLADFDAAMARQSKPRPALEIVRADVAGTLKGLVAIVLVFALLIAGAAAWGGSGV